jgi:inner membrane protein
MDTLTHALSGALLGRATAPRQPAPDSLSLRARVLAGAAAAAFPDLDFVLGYVSPVAYLENHRGVTHSLLLLPLWALLLAWLLAKIARDRRGPGPWYGICAIGLAAHVAGDLITSFGTMILAPVSRERFGLGTTFIIDLWFTGIIVAGLLGSLLFRDTRLPARIAAGVLVAYVGFQALQKDEATGLGERYAAAQGWRNARVSVQPRPVSPFNWTVFVETDDRVDFAHVNTRRDHVLPAAEASSGFVARLDAAYRPLAQAQWNTRSRYGHSDRERVLARAAWSAGSLAFFRWFADVPVVDGVSPDGTCVWFRDLRFETPGRDRMPFRYGVCRPDADAPWQLQAAG